MVSGQLDEQIGLLLRYLNMVKGPQYRNTNGTIYFYEAILLRYEHCGDSDYNGGKEIAQKHYVKVGSVTSAMNLVYLKARRTRRWEVNLLLEGYQAPSVWLMVQQMVKWLQRYVGTLQLNYASGEYDIVWKRKAGRCRFSLKKLLQTALPAIQIGDLNIVNVAPHKGIAAIVTMNSPPRNHQGCRRRALPPNHKFSGRKNAQGLRIPLRRSAL